MDTRRGTPPWLWDEIFGARVERSGNVLDPNGIYIAGALDHHDMNPSVAFCNGSNYLVAWTDYRNGPSHIFGARVSKYGQVLDTNGFVIAGATGFPTSPAVASDGINYLVVWQVQGIKGIG